MFALVALVLAAPLTFEALAPGIEYGTTPWIAQPAFGDGVLHVVRIDSKKAELVTGFASREGVTGKPSCRLVPGVASGAGMRISTQTQGNS